MSPLRLYLDNSVLNRPFDDQRQARIWLETLAFSLVLSMVESGEAEMIASAVHTLENDASPERLRRDWVRKFLRLATIDAPATEPVLFRGRQLEGLGLKPLDALHVSSAEVAKATHFLTCDDRLIRRYDGPLEIMSPPFFITTIA